MDHVKAFAHVAGSERRKSLRFTRLVDRTSRHNRTRGCAGNRFKYWRNWARRNGANGMGDIEGKAAREAARECGNPPSFKRRPAPLFKNFSRPSASSRSM